MKVLILFRHGKSDWSAEGASDFNRPLNSRGIRETLEQAQRLLREGYRPDGILSSPAIRAWHTAHLIAQVVSLPHAQVKPVQEFYEGDREAIYQAIADLPSAWKEVLLVGHNPLWSELASAWSGNPIELRTAEAVGFSLPAECPWTQWRSVKLAPLFSLMKPA